MSQLFSDIATITSVAGLGPVVSGNSANPAEFPSSSGLSFVAKDGSIGQIQSGSFGTLGFGNIWSALGLSPFPPGAVAGRSYGLRLQRNTDFALLQLEERNPGDGTNDDVDTVIAWGDNTDDRLRFKFVDPANAVTEVMTLLPNGNVGIGAINPQTRLDVRNSAFLAARFVNTAATTGNRTVLVDLVNGAGTTWRYGVSGVNNGLSIADGAFYLERLGAGSLFTVLPNGRIGIGTITPSRLLHVQGTGIHSGGAGAGFSFGNRETPNFVETPSAGERWVWYSTGGIARLWSGGDKVSVNTSGVVNATQFISSSSKELKENIAEISSSEAIETLKNLNPVKFNYKEDNEKNQYMGFIAEDVPALVATSDRKGINAMDVIAVLTKALQEQQITISALAQKVKSLETVKN